MELPRRFLFCLFYVNLIYHLCSAKYLLSHGRLRRSKEIHEVNSYKSEELPKGEWLQQKLNHFDPSDERMWNQRYFVNTSFHKTGGPVFLEIGGEGEAVGKENECKAGPIYEVKGQTLNYAKKYGALVVMLEHRYYGKSHPTEDLSVENLVYLTSEQALADLAYFQSYIKRKYDLVNNKWIAFGCSYAGSLAAWFRLKYPHLVHGSVASSAPVLAVVDFKDYARVVKESLSTKGENCNNAIREAVQEMDRLLVQRECWQELQKTFSLCDEFDGTIKNDVANLYYSLAGNFFIAVQYNFDNVFSIDTVCDIMTNSTLGSPLQRYANVNNLQLNPNAEEEEETCFDFKYDNLIKNLRIVSWSKDTSNYQRQWTYQTCVEFGFFDSSNLSDQPFGNKFPVSFFTQMCEDIFGSNFTLERLQRGVNHTNNDYGGLNMKVTNVVFPNGSIDPWHALGVTHNLSSSAVAVYIKGTAHCEDTSSDSHNDSQQLREARQQIGEHIRQWLTTDL